MTDFFSFGKWSGRTTSEHDLRLFLRPIFDEIKSGSKFEFILHRSNDFTTREKIITIQLHIKE